MKALINGKIIHDDDIFTGQAIIFDECIRAILPQSEIDKEQLSGIIDAHDCFISPGFINMHIHGCSGFDTMDDSQESIIAMSNALPQMGVTAFLPTTMTYELSAIKQVMYRIRSSSKNSSGARVLGANMEGPFINSEYKGAHDPNYIVLPDYDIIREYSDVIKIITVAPETIKDSCFIQECKRSNIVLSIGHSAATYEEAKMAIKKGFSHITHMYNAMPIFNHREPGVIGAAMDSAAICELITDNVHVHPAMQRILLKQKGINNIVLVTDSMRACMLPEGKYDLGGQVVIVEDGTAKLKNGVIAGSLLMMNKALKNFKKNTGINFNQVVKTVTVNPAKELNIYNKQGSIDIGKVADITIFNDDFDIQTTIVNGHIKYRRN